MTKDELLQATLDVLNGGSAWCKGSNARDSNNNPVPILSPKAISWDIFGALLVANVNQDTFKEYHEVYDHLKNNIPDSYKNKDIESYNDDSTWAEISSLFN